MLFGNSKDEVINLWMHNEKIEQVNKIKYLGVWLDPLLNFSNQVDYVICKATRSAAKVCRKGPTLFDGREGISVSLGVQLYKSLVRPHLENDMAVWASASAKDLEKVEQTQIQCLRRVIGAKAHSSGSAVEVITGTMPMRILIRELCSREYLRILCKDEAHYLRQLLSSSVRKGLCFCPLNYLSLMSKKCVEALKDVLFPVR